MKNTSKIHGAEELKLFKEIESGKCKSLPKKEFEKEKIRFQKIATKTVKKPKKSEIRKGWAKAFKVGKRPLRKSEKVDYIETEFDKTEWVWE